MCTKEMLLPEGEQETQSYCNMATHPTRTRNFAFDSLVSDRTIAPMRLTGRCTVGSAISANSWIKHASEGLSIEFTFSHWQVEERLSYNTLRTISC